MSERRYAWLSVRCGWIHTWRLTWTVALIIHFCCKSHSQTPESQVCPSSTGSAYLDLRARNVTLTSSTMTHLFLNATFQCRGRVHQWTYYRTHRTPRIFASVWRREETPDGYFRLVGKNVLPPGDLGRHTVNVKEKERFEVKPGDFIGFFYSNTVYKYNDPGAIAVVRRNQTTGHVVYRALLAGYFDENFNVDMPHTFHTNDRTEMMLQPALQAHLEFTHAHNNFSVRLTSCRGSYASLDCHNATINVHAASYGRTQVACGIRSLALGCKADVTSLVADLCTQKTSCRFVVDDTLFGDPCFGLEEFLDVEYSCSDDGSLTSSSATSEAITTTSEATSSSQPSTDGLTTAALSSTEASTTTSTHPTTAPTTITTTTSTSPTTITEVTRGVWLAETTTAPRLEVHPRPASDIWSLASELETHSSTTATQATERPVKEPSITISTVTSTTTPTTAPGRNFSSSTVAVREPAVSRTSTMDQLVTVKTTTTDDHDDEQEDDDDLPPTGFTYVVQNLGTVVGGVVAGLVFLTLLLVTFLLCKRSQKKSESNKLVQCRLLEPHLRRNPLYAPPVTAGTPAHSPPPHCPYQISTLQHHYERISSLTRGQQPPEQRPRCFYSIPNKKRARKGSTEEMLKKPPDDSTVRTQVKEPLVTHDLPPQRPKSLELPPLPMQPLTFTPRSEVEVTGGMRRSTWTPSATFPRPSVGGGQQQQQQGGVGEVGGSVRDVSHIYETVTDVEGDTQPAVLSSSH